MQRDKDCPVQGALDILGGKWRMAIIYTLSKKSPQRFKAIERSVKGITPRMLIKELKDLEANGILSRAHFPTIPPTVEYALTDFGETTLPIVRELKKWGKKQVITDENTLYDPEEEMHDRIIPVEENPQAKEKIVSAAWEDKNYPIDETTSEDIVETEQPANILTTETQDDSFVEMEMLEITQEPDLKTAITLYNEDVSTERLEAEPVISEAHIDNVLIDQAETEETIEAKEEKEAFSGQTDGESSFIDETTSVETEVTAVAESDDSAEEQSPQGNTLKTEPVNENPTDSAKEEDTSDSKNEDTDEQEKSSPQQFSLF